jgi:hypothetical protein
MFYGFPELASMKYASEIGCMKYITMEIELDKKDVVIIREEERGSIGY